MYNHSVLRDYKYILQNREAVIEDDLMAWAEWYEHADTSIARTDLPGDVTVSTIFLGLDFNLGHGKPQLFETLIMGGARDREVTRYSTYNEAEEGHARILAQLGKEPTHATP